ncbi:uncharacterized protein N7458_006727 [Penicillium daleae]|uniref:Uncharacterized protein n=1 Tax=Penicillium daleae TaxID=63821 RepID=A0AAD6C7M5_9EURO|nr:uncharacterized protein N7458_006727 [Penicillium daleae]KAJ5450278.1 hypothetical protein N7458_006727 [Penicillium daleae]
MLTQEKFPGQATARTEGLTAQAIGARIGVPCQGRMAQLRRLMQDLDWCWEFDDLMISEDLARELVSMTRLGTDPRAKASSVEVSSVETYTVSLPVVSDATSPKRHGRSKERVKGLLTRPDQPENSPKEGMSDERLKLGTRA